jgi:hypothetical protein
VNGIAGQVQRDQEGSKRVLRFVLTKPDGTRIAVEMRGDEIRVVLNDGDLVVLHTGPAVLAADGVYRPQRLRNESTGSVVVAWQPPLLRRAVQPAVITLTSAIISTGVTLLMTALLTGEGAPENKSRPVDRTSPSATTTTPSIDGSPQKSTDDGDVLGLSSIEVALVVCGIVLCVGLIGLVVLRRREQGKDLERSQVTWPVVCGLLMGIVAAIIVSS